MPGAGGKLHSQTIDVVVRTVERMNFQFAAVAGAGVDVADRHRLAEHLEDFRMQRLLARAQCGVGLGRRFGDEAGVEDLLEDQVRSHLINPVRCRRG